MGVPRFEVIHGPTNQIQYRLYDDKNNLVVTSDGFPSKDACFKAIQGIKENVRIGQRWELKTLDEKHFFILKAANHAVLAKGGPYKTVEDREKVMTVVRGAIEAAVQDKTT